MQRFVCKWTAIAMMAMGLAFGATACANEGIGEPCIPESIPCSKDKGCGFGAQESYVESSSVQCRSRVCIVHKLKGGDLADPRELCSNPPAAGDNPNCVTNDQLDQSVYCTCRCKDGKGKKVEGCECEGEFKCEEILTLGGDGIRGSYCVKPEPKIGT
jgi:hypothetical protein